MSNNQWIAGFIAAATCVSPLEYSGGIAATGIGTGFNQATGVSNGISALNAAATHAALTGKTLIIPAPRYNIASTFAPPAGIKIQFFGTLWGLSVTGPLVRVGAGGTSYGTYLRTSIKSMMLGGIASLEALLVDNAQLCDIDGCMAVPGARFLRMARFRATWGSSYKNFYSYSNDAENAVTVTGDCFVFGQNVNNCDFSNFYTSNITNGTAFLIDCDFNESLSSQSVIQSNTMSNFAAQGTRRGVWFRRCTGVVIRNLYVEEVAIPIVFGDVADSSGIKLAENCQVIGGYCAGASSGHASFSLGRAAIDFSYARSCRVTGVDWACCFGALEWASVAVTGGGGSGARAVAVVNRSGAIIGAHWVELGTGYTSTPTLTVTAGSPGGVPAGGSGGVLTATSTPQAGQPITVTAAGSGYGASLPYFPALARYHTAYDCEFDGMFSSMPSIAVGLQQPTWPLVVRASGALSQCGLNGKVYSRFGLHPTDGSPARLERAQSDGVVGLHYIVSLRGDFSGTQEARPFVPSVLA